MDVDDLRFDLFSNDKIYFLIRNIYRHFKRFVVHASLYVFNVVLRGKQDNFTLYLNRKDIIF